MDEDKASRFISSLVKSIQALCNGFVDFSNSIEVVGHIHLNIDRSVKLDYVLTEEVSKSVNEGSTVFASHSYHSHPPSSVSTKSASGSSNHNQKSRRDNDGDPLGLSALAREVPNSSKSDFHSGSRVGENSNSSSSVGFSRDSDSESIKPESSRLSSHFDDLSNRRRKMGPLSSQRTHSPAAKRSRVNDFGPNAKTVIKEQGFEVIEIKEEPDEEPNFFDSSGQMTAGQDIQTPDFSNVVMESLDRVTELEHGGGDGSGDMGSSQPVFPVMFHPSDGSMPSSSAGPMPGPSSDSQSVASTSGALRDKLDHGRERDNASFTHTADNASAVTSLPRWSASFEDMDVRRQHRSDVIKAAVDFVLQTGLPACRVCTLFDIPQATLYRHLTKAMKQREGTQAGGLEEDLCAAQRAPSTSFVERTSQPQFIRESDVKRFVQKTSQPQNSKASEIPPLFQRTCQPHSTQSVKETEVKPFAQRVSEAHSSQIQQSHRHTEPASFRHSTSLQHGAHSAQSSRKNEPAPSWPQTTSVQDSMHIVLVSQDATFPQQHSWSGKGEGVGNSGSGGEGGKVTEDLCLESSQEDEGGCSKS